MLRRVGSNSETVEDTGLRGVTDAQGNDTIVVPGPLSGPPWYTAVAETPTVATWAGRGTVGMAD